MQGEGQGIYRALIAINRGISAIAKKQENRQQGYKFRGIDDVMNALHPLFCEHGVVVIRRDLDLQVEEIVTAKGYKLHLATLKTEWMVTAEDGTHVSLIGIGQATDNSDKAVNKAASASYKTCLIELFSIPTIEVGSQDADLSTLEAVAPATQAQIERVRELVEETGADPIAITEYHGITSFDDLTAIQARLTITRLERRVKSPEAAQAERVQDATEKYIENAKE